MVLKLYINFISLLSSIFEILEISELVSTGNRSVHLSVKGIYVYLRQDELQPQILLPQLGKHRLVVCCT